MSVDMPREPVDYFKGPLGGVPIATKYPPGDMPGIVWFEDTTTGIRYLKTVAAGVPTWESLGTSDVVAANDIVIGTGTGITGSPNAQYDIAAGDLTIKNAAGKRVLATTGSTSQVDLYDDQSPQIPVLEVQGQQSIGKRGAFVIDDGAQTIVSIPAMIANRALIVADQGGNPIEKIDATTAGRTIKEIDSNNVTMRTVSTVGAVRTDQEFDANGVAFRKVFLTTGLYKALRFRCAPAFASRRRTTTPAVWCSLSYSHKAPRPGSSMSSIRWEARSTRSIRCFPRVRGRRPTRRERKRCSRTSRPRRASTASAASTRRTRGPTPWPSALRTRCTRTRG